MTSIMLTVTGARVQALVNGTLTSGMVGVPVTIEYDDSWNGLTKNLVCRCSKSGSADEECRSILNVGNTAVVAHEVMKAGMILYLGVEGRNADGTQVIPTTWAMCGVIQRGANTGADLSADPTLPVWGQLQEEIERLREASVTSESFHIGPDEPAGEIRPLYWLDTGMKQAPADPEEKTMTGITAVYTGGEVAVGTAVTALTGIVVTASYSDGSTEAVTDYTLSGTINEGGNTITATYQGKTATFTVIGVAESGGEEPPDLDTFILSEPWLTNKGQIIEGTAAENKPLTSYWQSAYDTLYAVTYYPKRTNSYNAMAAYLYKYDYNYGVPRFLKGAAVGESGQNPSAANNYKIGWRKLVKTDVQTVMETNGLTVDDVVAIMLSGSEVPANEGTTTVWMATEPTEAQLSAIVDYFANGGVL